MLFATAFAQVEAPSLDTLREPPASRETLAAQRALRYADALLSQSRKS